MQENNDKQALFRDKKMYISHVRPRERLATGLLQSVPVSRGCTEREVTYQSTFIVK